MIALAALFAGFGLTALVMIWGKGALADQTGLLIEPQIDMQTVCYLVVGAFVIAAAAALFPAIRAARTPIEELLQS